MIVFGLFFFVVDIEKIIAFLGVRNSYFILFFVAMIAGSSSFTSSSYYATIIGFAVNGLNPFMIALVAGVGLTLGDTIFYFLGMWGRNNISGRVKHWTEKYGTWLSKKPKWIIKSIVYFYTGFTPLPGDFLMVALSFARFPFKSFIVPSLLGNITLVVFIVIGVLWTVRIVP